MEEGAASQGVWTFRIGGSCLTYEGGFILADAQGEHKKKLKHGTGVMRWQDGRVYRGEFLFDKMHGEGIMSWPTGAKYVGQYCDNRKGGFGKMTMPDGSSLEGPWRQGMRHGDFLYIDPQLVVFHVEYDLDQQVKRELISSFEGPTWILRPGYDVFIKSKDVEGSEHNEVTCSICLDDLSIGDTCCTMYCQHVFHKECIDSWTMRKNECPLCKRKIRLHKHYEI